MRALKVRPSQPELSVVAPLHNEEANVCALFQAICAALEPLGRSFEVLLVDDGSTDSTGDLLDELAADDPRLSPVHLEGNYGEAAALCAGFEHARAPLVLTLDGDQAANLVSRLRLRCERQLSRAKRPVEFRIVAALPLTATGKVARRRLRQSLVDDARRSEAVPL